MPIACLSRVRLRAYDHARLQVCSRARKIGQDPSEPSAPQDLSLNFRTKARIGLILRVLRTLRINGLTSSVPRNIRWIFLGMIQLTRAEPRVIHFLNRGPKPKNQGSEVKNDHEV